MHMDFASAGIAVLATLQIIASVYFCISGAYYFFMVCVHVRHRKAMQKHDEEIWQSWNRAPDQLPFVTVQLPIYNEQYVITQLIQTIVRLDYPRDRLEIQVLDDSDDITTQMATDLVAKYQAEGFDIALHRRPDRSGFKAGNLKAGHQIARGEFIVIFDADFIPQPDFLMKSLPFFDDPKLGAVQALWGHLNAGYSLMTIAQSVGLDGHNYVIKCAQCWSGAITYFQGSAGVWRKAAIDDAGGWQIDTLTEDLDLSCRAQIKGWTLKYLPHVTCPGELPTTASAAKAQQHRWTKGGFQVTLKLLPTILRSELSVYAKAEVMLCMGAWLLQSYILVIALSWPLQALLHKNLVLSWITVVLPLFSLGPGILFIYAQKCLYPDWPRRIHYYLYLMLWGVGISINNAKAVLEVIFGFKSGFVRTPKLRMSGDAGVTVSAADRSRLSWQVILEVLVAAYCLVGVVYLALQDKPVLDSFLIVFAAGTFIVAGQTIWEPIAQRRATLRLQRLQAARDPSESTL